MKALDAYRSTLKELDKHESPTFSVDDFNWFFNESVDQYVSKNYGVGDIFQKDLDDISKIVKDDVALTQDGGDKTLFSKPADYRHLLYLKVRAKALSTFRKWTLNQEQDFVIRRQRFSRRGYQEENAYEQPSEDYPQYRVSNEKLKILIGTRFEPVSAKIMYISKPAVVYLNPDDSSDYNQEGNNSTLEFPDYVCKEIIRWCSRLFLENIESPRYQTALAERQMNGKE